MKTYFNILVYALLALGISCGENDGSIDIDPSDLPAIAEFPVSVISISESVGTLSLTVSLDRPAPTSGTIEMSVNNISAVYGSDYTLAPEPENELITLPVDIGDIEVSVALNLINDGDQDIEQVEFTMIAASGGVRLANRNILLVTITDESNEQDPKYANCLEPLKNDELNVVTWNIEFFPMDGNPTVALVSEIIENLEADVIAVQEINDIGDFNTLAAGLTGWSGQVINLSGSLDIGYLYKTSEISIVSNARAVLSGSVSPRPPVEITLKHTNGLEVTLLNIHLKCCGGQDNINRRAAASIAIKDYIDQNLSNENVIVLGDFNDEIDSSSPFLNFMNDSDNYSFADAGIAAGSSANWSYPSWPSHIDHILITNELVDNLIDVKTLRLNICLSNYTSVVSDHRPVMATFR